jgi:hypothetical protein
MKKLENIMQGLNAPQFPGQQVKGMTIEQIRTLVKKQNRIKGYNFSVATGTQNFQFTIIRNRAYFIRAIFNTP